MQPDPLDSSDEGGDPACWAHLFDPGDETLVDRDRDDESGAPDRQAASGPAPA